MSKKLENNNKSNNNLESELYEDLDSSKESQTVTMKGLEHITEEYRNKLMSFIQDKIKEIKKQEHDIKGEINNLAQTIQEIVDKNHKDFISTFANFMDSVRKDLKLKLEQMEKIEEEKRKINDIRSIKCERDYFRLEAIRLSRLTNSLKKKIEEMNLQIKYSVSALNDGVHQSKSAKDSPIAIVNTSCFAPKYLPVATSLDVLPTIVFAVNVQGPEIVIGSDSE